MNTSHEYILLKNGASLSMCMCRTWSEQLHAYDCYRNVTEHSITSGHRILHEMYIQMPQCMHSSSTIKNGELWKNMMSHSTGTMGLASRSIQQ